MVIVLKQELVNFCIEIDNIMNSQEMFAVSPLLPIEYKLYSSICSLLDDAFRLDFIKEEFNEDMQKLNLLLRQLKIRLVQLMNFEQRQVSSAVPKDNDSVSSYPSIEYTNGLTLKEKYRQDISFLISKIEKDHFVLNQSLSNKLDNLIPVLKLLFQ